MIFVKDRGENIATAIELLFTWAFAAVATRVTGPLDLFKTFWDNAHTLEVAW